MALQINATNRLSTQVRAAATRPQLRKFLEGLNDDELQFFYYDLPSLVDAWFYSIPKKESKHLPMHFAAVKAATYNRVDAIAVALGHVKSIYPPKLPATIQRSILLPKNAGLPAKKVFDFVSPKKWSAIQSWTMLSDPIVQDRDVKHGDQELVLSIPSAKASKHVVADYVQLGRLAADAIALSPYFKKKRPDVLVGEAHWKGVTQALKNFAKEKEVLMYVPSGQPLKCSWVAYSWDEDKGRLPLEAPKGKGKGKK